MAKQIGGTILSGRVDNIVYYQTKDGRNLARRVYEHTGKKVKTAPEYATTRGLCQTFGNISWFTRNVYRGILTYMPKVLQGTFFNQFISYTKKTNSGYPGPKARPDVVPFMNGQLRNSNLLYLPSQAADDSISVTGNTITFGTKIFFPASSYDYMIESGVNCIDYKIIAFAMEIPFLIGNGEYSFTPPQVQVLKADSGVQIADDEDATLIAPNTSFNLTSVNARALCNYNGGSTFCFGGIFFYACPWGLTPIYDKDYIVGSFVVPKLIS